MPGASRRLFEWEGTNSGHIARHGVTPGEAEEVISGASVRLREEERGGELRHVELGETNTGRLLVVVWTWSRERVRVVAAFPANRKWRVLWKRLKKGV